MLQDRVFDGLPNLQALILNNVIAAIGLHVFTNESDVRSLRRVDMEQNRLRSIDTWPFLLGIIAGCPQQDVSVALRYNNITNNAGFAVGCDQRLSSFVEITLGFNAFSHVLALLNGFGITSLTELLCMYGGSLPNDQWYKSVHIYLNRNALP